MRIQVSRVYLLSVATLVAAVFANASAQQSTPADTTRYVFLFSDHPAGALKIWHEGPAVVSDFEFNDRGRGPHIRERFTADSAGYITNATISGHNYLKDSVDERFAYSNGTSSWKNHVEGTASRPGPITFYSSLDG